ncbi:MAG TPA: hypothetical protein PLV41_03605 [Miltoncostaeales bacterium]|jgi:predicted amidophosphoribosyltransferase|nr:hypothetical protein [Miltoncostaeales bacterium]
MRVESNRQGHHRQEAPACHRCGIPLLEDSNYCPYCEQPIDDGLIDTRLRRAAAPTVATRTLLGIGVVFFAVVAFICLVAAFVI